MKNNPIENSITAVIIVEIFEKGSAIDISPKAMPLTENIIPTISEIVFNRFILLLKNRITILPINSVKKK